MDRMGYLGKTNYFVLEKNGERSHKVDVFDNSPFGKLRSSEVTVKMTHLLAWELFTTTR